jgi:hypothetical protein
MEYNRAKKGKTNLVNELTCNKQLDRIFIIFFEITLIQIKLTILIILSLIKKKIITNILIFIFPLILY